MKEEEEKKRLARREELEHIQLRKAADEVFRRNEMEKEERRYLESQKCTEFLFSQMVSAEIIVDGPLYTFEVFMSLNLFFEEKSICDFCYRVEIIKKT